ncbi:hypothetical protein [Sphaerothrix gracilis]|uniref:hypothetical protein n=1 Tax=Sphaerothrix gracilis TaxID=3151835 RepID=UPI0031FBEA66
MLTVRLRCLGKLLLITSLVAGIAAFQSARLHPLIDPDEQTFISPETKQQNFAQQQWLKLLKKIPDFSFANLIADWSFLSFLQYFGNEEQREAIGYDLSPEYFEVIVEKDPRFLLPYLYLSNSVSIYAAQPERSISLMQRGLEAMTPQVPPRSYFIWRYKAIDELLFLGDTEAAQKSLEMAAKWAEESPDPEAESVATYSRQTAAYLKNNPASKTARMSAWIQVLINAVSDRTRQIAIQNIELLGGEILVQEDGQVTVRYDLED